MSRSLKKGPFTDEKLLKKVAKASPNNDKDPIKTWSRPSVITPEMVDYVFDVHAGNKFIKVKVTEDMVGHRLGEFAPTKNFMKHGGKMQKELEKKKKQ